MDDLIDRAIAVVAQHPEVQRVELAGSRARGMHESLSDWDFAVTTPDFAAVERDMPALVAALDPLGEQWEPLGGFPVYQVLLPGPTKVEYLFLGHAQDPKPPLTPGKDTLAAIDTHFRDWIWYIATKASTGHDDLTAEHLSQLHRRLLRPLGASERPQSVDAAIAQFVERRDALERRYGLTLLRRLETEVRQGIERLDLAGRSQRPSVRPAPG